MSLNDFFTQELYEKAVIESAEYKEFQDDDNVMSARALTLKMYDALHDAIDPTQTRVGVLLNSSTGKDSTATVAMFYINALKRKLEGKYVAPAMVCIADTAAEFPEMELRMYSEFDKINEHAKKQGIDLECRIIRPKVKNQLLVELIGNGLMLPQLTSGSTSGYSGAKNWCMDRVKGRPLKIITKMAGDRFDYYIQAAGVRSDESTRRKTTIAGYSSGYPFGLTQLGEESDKHIGFTPVVHWSDSHIRDWMDFMEIPWDHASGENLRSIYMQGSPTGSEEGVGQCSVVVTSDGFGNICSDLSGTRYGCWMCFKSVNKSMKNTAKRNPQYKWLRLFDRYVKYQHKLGNKLREYRNVYGFNVETMFPKGFTLRQRINFLMIIFRAELESGFELLKEDALDAIRMMWKKHGLYTLDPEDIREDARRWKETGRPVRSWDNPDNNMCEINMALGEGTPAAIYYNFLHPEVFDKLYLGNLVPLLKQGSPILPQLRTYVFRDRIHPDQIIHMVTDTPSFLATKTAKYLVNGMSPMRWNLECVRRSTDWEKEVSSGRCLFYVLDEKEMKDRIMTKQWYMNPEWSGHFDKRYFDKKMLKRLRKKRKVQSNGTPIRRFHLPVEKAFMRSKEAIFEGGYRYDDLFAHLWQEGEEYHADRNRLTSPKVEVIENVCRELINLGDHLTELAAEDQARILKMIKGKEDLLDNNTDVGRLKESDKFRKKLRKYLKTEIPLEDRWKVCEEYLNCLRALLRHVKDNDLSASYVVRTCQDLRKQMWDAPSEIWEEDAQEDFELIMI